MLEFVWTSLLLTNFNLYSSDSLEVFTDPVPLVFYHLPFIFLPLTFNLCFILVLGEI